MSRTTWNGRDGFFFMARDSSALFAARQAKLQNRTSRLLRLCAIPDVPSVRRAAALSPSPSPPPANRQEMAPPLSLFKEGPSPRATNGRDPAPGPGGGGAARRESRQALARREGRGREAPDRLEGGRGRRDGGAPPDSRGDRRDARAGAASHERGELGWTPKDPVAYASDEPWPAETAGAHRSHVPRGFSLRDDPPEAALLRRVRAQALRPSQIKVVGAIEEEEEPGALGGGAKGGAGAAAAPFRPGDPSGRFQERLNGMVVNPFREADALTQASAKAKAGKTSKGNDEGEPEAKAGSCTYLLITGEALAPAFQRLVDFRKKFNGVTAELVTVETIDATYDGTRPSGGTDIQTKIRNCIKAYVQDKGTEYVCLGGDDTVVPDRDCYVYGTTATGSYDDMPTDLYYSGLTARGTPMPTASRQGERGRLRPRARRGRLPNPRPDGGTRGQLRQEAGRLRAERRRQRRHALEVLPRRRDGVGIRLGHEQPVAARDGRSRRSTTGSPPTPAARPARPTARSGAAASGATSSPRRNTASSRRSSTTRSRRGTRRSKATTSRTRPPW